MNQLSRSMKRWGAAIVGTIILIAFVYAPLLIGDIIPLPPGVGSFTVVGYFTTMGWALGSVLVIYWLAGFVFRPRQQ